MLVEVRQAGFNGFPCRCVKGQLLSPHVSKGFKRLDDGQLEVNLERCYTPEGRAYFATDEGRADLARLVHYIKTHRLNPRLK